MSVETSKKVLKISGILCIIFAVLFLITGILLLATGGVMATELDMGSEDNLNVTGITLGGGIMIVITGIVTLIEGIFSLRGAKDSTKITPAWVFAIIGLICGVISFISSLGSGANGIISNLVSLLISVLIFVAANSIRKDNRNSL